MERYGTHCEQTYRTNFNRGRAKCIDWVKFNLALCRRYLNMDGLLNHRKTTNKCINNRNCLPNNTLLIYIVPKQAI